MKLNEIRSGHVYHHPSKGDVTIVGVHPWDGAAFVGARWDTEEDEEKYELFIPENFTHEVVQELQDSQVPHPRTIIEMLIRVASAARCLMDNSEDGIHVQLSDHEELSHALEDLNALPDRKPGCVMDGPGKAEYLLGLGAGR